MGSKVSKHKFIPVLLGGDIQTSFHHQSFGLDSKECSNQKEIGFLSSLVGFENHPSCRCCWLTRYLDGGWLGVVDAGRSKVGTQRRFERICHDTATALIQHHRTTTISKTHNCVHYCPSFRGYSCSLHEKTETGAVRKHTLLLGVKSYLTSNMSSVAISASLRMTLWSLTQELPWSSNTAAPEQT